MKDEQTPGVVGGVDFLEGVKKRGPEPLRGPVLVVGVTPDICVYGKAVAGGAVPVSVIMGRREIMDMYAQFRAIHGGSWSTTPPRDSWALSRAGSSGPRESS